MYISTNIYVGTAKSGTASSLKPNARDLKDISAKLKSAGSQDQITVSSKGRSSSAAARTADTESLDTFDSTTQIEFVFAPAAKYVKYTKLIDEHYAKINEENLKFSDPSKHIYDKYFNRKSKYYIKDLTNRERELCFSNENLVLDGLTPAVSHYDPIIQKTYGGLNAFAAEVECTQEGRAKTNASINKIFAQNGIIIPEDADLKLTVDPYDFKIRASGVDDELARDIEEALNKGKNGANLYYQIENSNPGSWGLPQAPQFMKGDTGKRAIFHVVKELTGYDIREMNYENGKIYTPDGQDLWELLNQKAGEMSADSKTPISMSQYSGYYNQVAQMGWETSTDFDLSIGYKNGSLYDIDTEYGYGPGQTDWQDELFSQVKRDQEAYRAEREETIRREAAEQKPSIFIDDIPMDSRSNGGLTGYIIEAQKMRKQMGLFGIDGTFYPVKPISQETMDHINRLFKNGLKPLNDEIMSLPR